MWAVARKLQSYALRRMPQRMDLSLSSPCIHKLLHRGASSKRHRQRQGRGVSQKTHLSFKGARLPNTAQAVHVGPHVEGFKKLSGVVLLSWGPPVVKQLFEWPEIPKRERLVGPEQSLERGEQGAWQEILPTLSMRPQQTQHGAIRITDTRPVQEFGLQDGRSSHLASSKHCRSHSIIRVDRGIRD